MAIGDDIKNQITKAVQDSISKQAEAFDKIQGPLERLGEAMAQITRAQKDMAKAGVDFSARFADSAENAEGFSLALSKAADSSAKFFGNVDAGIASFTTLASNMNSFVGMSENMQVTLTELAAKMEYVGFETAALAKTMDDQAMAFGKTEKQLKGFAKVMSRISRDLYVEPRKLLENFDLAQESFAYNAEKTLDVFVRMQKESRKTGVEFSQMARAFGDEMDTFQGATQIAGRLNAVLAQSVFNPIELLGLDPAERLNVIRERLVGQDFVQSALNDPNRKFELRALAQSLNMGTMDFRKLMTEGEADSLKGKMANRIEGRFTGTGGLQELAGDAGLGKLAESTDLTNSEMGLLNDTIRNLRSEAENFMIGLNNELAKSTRAGLARFATTQGVNPDLVKELENYPDQLMNAIFAAQAGTLKPKDKSMSPIQFGYGEGAKFDINKLRAPEGARGALKAAEQTAKQLQESAREALKLVGIEDPAIVEALAPVLIGGATKTIGNVTGTGTAGEAFGGLILSQKSKEIEEYMKKMARKLPSMPAGGAGSPSPSGGYIDMAIQTLNDIMPALDDAVFGPPPTGPGVWQAPSGRKPSETAQNARQFTLSTVRDILNEEFKTKFRTYLDLWLADSLR